MLAKATSHLTGAKKAIMPTNVEEYWLKSLGFPLGEGGAKASQHR